MENISTQLMQIVNGKMEFTSPVFHQLPNNKVADYCQFLADATQTKVRMTYASSGDVTAYNGHYFSPSIKKEFNYEKLWR